MLLTYAYVALVFFSCLTITWAGALVEVMLGGLLGVIFGAVVGVLFSSTSVGANFGGLILVAIIILALIKFVLFAKSFLPITMVALAAGVGTLMAAVIVANLANFYRYHSQSNFKFGVKQGTGLGAVIAGIFGTGYWAVITTAVFTASTKLIKHVGIYSAVPLLFLSLVSGITLGMVFNLTGFANLYAVYTVAFADFVLIGILLYSTKE